MTRAPVNKNCLPEFVYLLGFQKNYFRHQQSHSVALPELLFGHNYWGFKGAIEWDGKNGTGGGAPRITKINNKLEVREAAPAERKN